MTLECRCSNCGSLLQTTNADPLLDEIERLRKALELAANRLYEEGAPTFMVEDARDALTQGQTK